MVRVLGYIQERVRESEGSCAAGSQRAFLGFVRNRFVSSVLPWRLPLDPGLRSDLRSGRLSPPRRVAALLAGRLTCVRLIGGSDAGSSLPSIARDSAATSSDESVRCSPGWS